MALKRRDAPAKRKTGDVEKGFGSADITVKGKRATARQRRVLEGVLVQAAEDNASRRVMVAAVMCVTQESVAGEATQMTGNDDTGIYQQGRNWISVSGAKDPKRSTHAFLITGPTSWRKVHGSVKRAPGNLENAIKEVQISVGGYARWEREASRTVDVFLDISDENFRGDNYVKQYTFTRGERRGEKEHSWDASQRLLDDVGAFRWAAANVFYAVSGDELRRQKASLMIDGDEGWIRRGPAWSWGADRPISEVTLDVLADRWDIMPGGLVRIHRDLGAMAGRWLVWNVAGQRLDSPEVTVILRRPVQLRKEPASEFVSRPGDEGNESGDRRTGGRLRAVCQEISENRSEYDFGGGHGPPVSSLKSSTPMDCSSSTSLALHRAGFFAGNKPAFVSGQFATSWGEAGKGDDFTVWANDGHVWIEFPDGARFDTSQHGGKSGPAFTTVKRSDQSRFSARHYPGS